MPKPLTELLAELEAARERRALRKSLIWVYQVRDNQRVRVPHIGVPGRGLVELTPDQIADLGEL